MTTVCRQQQELRGVATQTVGTGSASASHHFICAPHPSLPNFSLPSRVSPLRLSVFPNRDELSLNCDRVPERQRASMEMCTGYSCMFPPCDACVQVWEAFFF